MNVFFCKTIHSLVFFFLGLCPYQSLVNVTLQFCNHSQAFFIEALPTLLPTDDFPRLFSDRWAFSFWILLFSFSDFSFKSWSFLILWLIAWRSVGFKGSSSESHSGIAACNELADSWQVVSQWSLMYLSTSALLVLVGGWVTSFFWQGGPPQFCQITRGWATENQYLKKKIFIAPPPPPPAVLYDRSLSLKKLYKFDY